MSDVNHPRAANGRWVLHYTDDDGFKAIGSQQTWVFKAHQPRGERPFGVYFTLLLPDSNKLSPGARIPKRKQQYLFAFEGTEGLAPVRGGKGEYNLWMGGNYEVAPHRQRFKGPAEELP